MSKKLDVYLHDEFIGLLEQVDSGDLVFTYDSHYLVSAKYAISLSLPLQAAPFTGAKVKAFFAGLLPEEGLRERLARQLGLSKNNAFALLEAIGGDCAGALAFYPTGNSRSVISEETETLDEAQLKNVLEMISHKPMLAGDDGYRLSLAGAQDKLAVGLQDGKVVLMKGGLPTTHIIKPLIQGITDSVYNELFCMKLAKKVGIIVPEVSVLFSDNMPYYVVKRYDRQINNDGRVSRIHQEDFCQAMGIVSEMKYEREGGPSVQNCQDIITKYTENPDVDKDRFMDMLLFNYFIGNADAHGKNFSLLYKDRKPELAPAYDLLSTAIYPGLSEKMAMKIGGVYKPRDIFPTHFYRLTVPTKAVEMAMSQKIKVMSEQIKHQASVLKSELEEENIFSEVFDQIMAIIEKRTKHFEAHI